MKRLLKFLLIAVPILVVLLLAAVQVVLWSDLPRRIIVAELERETGLDVELTSLRATWGGRTSLRDLRIALPLEDRPLLAVPSIRIEHTSLPGLVTGRGFNVYRIEADGPDVHLHRDEQGRWNVERLMAMLDQRRPPPPDRPRPLPPLPHVVFNDVSIHLADAAGRSEVLSQIALRLTPSGPAAGELDVDVPGLAHLEGELATRGEQRHELKATVRELKKLAAWLPDQRLEALEAELRWAGRVQDGGLRGQLHIERAGIAEGSARGEVGVEIRDGRIRATPRDLEVEAPRWLADPARIAGGAIVLEAGTVSWQDLVVRAFDGRASFRGDYHLAEQRGVAHGHWEDMALPEPLQHGGTIEANIDRGGPFGALRMAAGVTSHGATPWGTWDSALALNATGPAFTELSWELRQLDGRWSGDAIAAGAGTVTAAGRLADGVLTLNRFDLPVEVEGHGSARMVGHAGRLDLATQRWSVDGRLESLRAAVLGEAVGSARIEAFSDGERANFELRQLQAGPWSGSLDGWLSLADDGAVAVDYDLAHAAMTFELDDRHLASMAGASISGRADGTLSPLRVTHRTHLRADGLELGDGPAETVRFTVSGAVDEKGGNIESEPFTLLGAALRFEAAHQVASGQTTASVSLGGLGLGEADRFSDVPLQLGGTAGAQIDLSLNGFDPDTLEGEGSWHAEAVHHPWFIVDDAEGGIEVKDGRLNLRRIVARVGESEARGEVALSLDRPNEVAGSFSVTDWPAQHPVYPHFVAHATGEVGVQADLATMHLHGPVDVRTTLHYHDRLLGRAAVEGRFVEDRLELPQITAEMLDGRATGDAVIELASPWRSHLGMDIEAIDAGALLDWAPEIEFMVGLHPGSLNRALDGLSGTIDGRLVAAPDDSPRAPGPFRIDLELNPRQLVLERLEMGDVLLQAFVDDENDRILLHRGTIDLADGEVSLWGRMTKQRGHWFAYGNLQWDELSIDQLISLGDILDPARDEGLPEDIAGTPIPGRLSGRIHTGMPLADWTRASGGGRLSVRDSDFVRIPMFNELYRLMNLRIRAGRAEGRGEARLRLDGPTFRIERLDYTNRGARLNLNLAVLDLRQGTESPIEGYAVGILNPLPDIGLLRDLADAIAAYQGDMTTARIDGRIDAPEVRPIPFSLFREFTRAVGGAVGVEPAPVEELPAEEPEE